MSSTQLNISHLDRATTYIKKWFIPLPFLIPNTMDPENPALASPAETGWLWCPEGSRMVKCPTPVQFSCQETYSAQGKCFTFPLGFGKQLIITMRQPTFGGARYALIDHPDTSFEDTKDRWLGDTIPESDVQFNQVAICDYGNGQITLYFLQKITHKKYLVTAMLALNNFFGGEVEGLVKVVDMGKVVFSTPYPRDDEEHDPTDRVYGHVPEQLRQLPEQRDWNWEQDLYNGDADEEYVAEEQDIVVVLNNDPDVLDLTPITFDVQGNEDYIAAEAAFNCVVDEQAPVHVVNESFGLVDGKVLV